MCRERYFFRLENNLSAFKNRLFVVILHRSSELAGRGIDFKGVELVINYDFPQTTAAYIHRVGRTGRAGCTGRALTFFTEYDAPKLREIIQARFLR